MTNGMGLSTTSSKISPPSRAVTHRLPQRTRVRVIQIGLDPDVIDYGADDFAQFAGLTKEKLRKANDDNVAGLRAAGYDVDNCLIDFEEAGAAKAEHWLAAKHYDAVLIGAGIRLVPRNTLLFESIVNIAHALQPHCRFVFNYAAVSTPNDIGRWYPDPTAPTPSH